MGALVRQHMRWKGTEEFPHKRGMPRECGVTRRAETPTDLTIIGTGICLRRHLTLEAYRAIEKARRVYHLTADHEFLAHISQDLVDLTPLYLSRNDFSVYSEIAELLIEETNRERGVAFVTYGHPLLLVDTSQILLRRAREAGLTIGIVSGVSSLDSMMEVLGMDLGQGLQIFEAENLVRLSANPNPRLPSLVFQVGEFGSTALHEPARPCARGELRDLLVGAYGREHVASLVICSFRDDVSELRTAAPLAVLLSDDTIIPRGSTLFVPALVGSV